jgi:citrate lyase subunit beta / citryl-CoA lyase
MQDAGGKMKVMRAAGLRRSKLITPGHNFEMIAKATTSAADVIHLEFEDGVARADKAAAREVGLRAMCELAWGNKEVWLRINPFGTGFTEDDVNVLVAGRPNLILLTKVQGPEDMIRLDALVTAAERKHSIPVGETKTGAVIERIRGLARVEEIAASTQRMGVLQFGMDDMANEYRYRQTREPGKGVETVYARSRIVLAARLAGIDCIDSPFIKYKDLEGSEIEARFSAQLGFDGKSAISPLQLTAINKAFSSSDDELKWARDVIAAAETPTNSSKVVFTVDGMMIDAPHVMQADRILARRHAGE